MTERHFPLERLARALRADGVFCEIRAGAQGKSAKAFASVGYYRGCQAVTQHHTVSSGANPSSDIAYIDGGKSPGFIISNAYTSTAGVVTLIASGPTYTEGAGGPWGIIPQDRANDVCFSNEIASWGAFDSVYPKAQQDAVAAFAYHAGLIAADVWGWPDDPFGKYRSFAHHEWTTRKVDPRGVSRWSPRGGEWNMDAFRVELRNRTSEEDDMTPLPVPERVYDSRQSGGELAPNLVRKIPIGMVKKAHLNVTAIAVDPGFVTISGTPTKPATSLLNFDQANVRQVRSGSVPVALPDGHLYVWSTTPIHVIVDVYARG